MLPTLHVCLGDAVMTSQYVLVGGTAPTLNLIGALPTAAATRTAMAAAVLATLFSLQVQSGLGCGATLSVQERSTTQTFSLWVVHSTGTLVTPEREREREREREGETHARTHTHTHTNTLSVICIDSKLPLPVSPASGASRCNRTPHCMLTCTHSVAS